MSDNDSPTRAETISSNPGENPNVEDNRRWKFLTDQEINSFLKANGSSQDSKLFLSFGVDIQDCGRLGLRKHLFDANLFSTDRTKGKEAKSYRVDIHHRGQKHKIGYIRLWISAFMAHQEEGFTWEEYVPSVLGLSAEQVGEWPEIVKRVYDKLDKLNLRAIISSSRKRWTDEFWRTTTDILGQDPEKLDMEDDFERQESKVEQDFEMDVEEDDEIIEIDDDDKGLQPEVNDDVSVRKRMFFPVVQIFVEDMLLGLGLRRSSVEKKYEVKDSDQCISLDQKLKLIKNKIAHKMSTYRGYIRAANLFLLWLNDKEPELWEESGLLLATQHNVYAFLEELRTGLIRSTGAEPPISHVLNATAIFDKHADPNAPLSSSNGAKILSGLSFLYDAQQTLMNAPRVETLRSFRTFSLWESNLQYAETDRRKENFQDRQRNVFATECPLTCKKRHSVHLLMEDTWLAIRNRALSLCQAFSVSRFDELSKWSISDLHVFNYSSELPTVGEQDIQVIYVHQAEHKTLKDGRSPDEKLIIRHKDLLLCPLSALAVMMFERFVCSNEKPVDLTNMESWYNVKVFRTLKDSEKAIPRHCAYEQRREMMENTSTATNGCVNHYDRKLGALIARLHGVRNSELKALGLWDPAVLDKHYSKYALPDTVSKLSGFSSGYSYFLPRARPDPMHFQEIHGGAEMFSSFFPFLDDPNVFQSVLEKRNEGNNTCFNVYQALHYIRTTFWQDIPHYYARYPQLKIFKSNALVGHWATFMTWVDYVNEQTFHVPSPCSRRIKLDAEDDESDGLHLPVDFEAWKEKIEFSINDLKRITDSNSAKLDRLLHALEHQGSSGGKRKREAIPEFRKNVNPESRQVLRKLRDLNDMSIRDVYEEWHVKVISEGREYGALKDYEQRRTEMKEQYRSDNLKTAIARRRHLCYFIDQTANELGSLERAFKWIEDLQLKIGKGKTCSLHKLWKHICSY